MNLLIVPKTITYHIKGVSISFLYGIPSYVLLVNMCQLDV